MHRPHRCLHGHGNLLTRLRLSLAPSLPTQQALTNSSSSRSAKQAVMSPIVVVVGSAALAECNQAVVTSVQVLWTAGQAWTSKAL